MVALADLPSGERLAVVGKEIADLHLDPGEYDDAAHKAFLGASPARRERAERKAAIARLLVSLGDSIIWAERLKLVHDKFGKKGTSKLRLLALLKTIDGVDPINFAPALLDSYKGKKPSAKLSDKAWAFFMESLQRAGPEFPLKQAWRDVRDVAKVQMWSWPSYPTVNRRWLDLPEFERRKVRLGRSEAKKQLRQPIHRDKTTIGALEWVSLDGRTLDFWTDIGDGKKARITMLALIDVATNMVLGYELSPSENATSTVRLIRNVCVKHGIFDRLYTDNGSAFAGHLVAGGTSFRFRNAKTKSNPVQPLGICHHLGITIRFALPGNAQAKIAERTFASLSRVIDDRPEFKGAHAGHSAGASPTSKVSAVPLATVEAVIQREVERYNSETGRRAQGAHGRSYAQMFKASQETRIQRFPTKRQKYLASLVYTPVSVNRHGQIVRDQWIYGSTTTQEILLKYHGTGRKILLGRDPDDLNAPAIAFDEDRRLICEDIEAIQRGPYDSIDGIRDAQRNQKAVQAAISAGEKAQSYELASEFDRILKSLDEVSEITPPDLPPMRKVVGARFGSPLREAAELESPPVDETPADYYKNLDSYLAANRKNKKPA